MKILLLLIGVLLISCKPKDESFRIDTQLVTMAYLLAHGTPLYPETQKKIQEMLNYGDTIILAKDDLTVVRFYDPPYTNDLVPIYQRIVYIQSPKKAFKYAFPIPDELCYLEVNTDCRNSYYELDINSCKNRSFLVANINYIFSELSISKLDEAKRIVHAILGEPINNEEELQSKKTMDLISDPFFHHENIKECCSNALDSVKLILKRKNDNIELLESQFRGVWKANYALADNIYKIYLEYLLTECIPAYPMGYTSYHVKIFRDSLDQLKQNEQ